jgi:hypothetical protein
MMVSDPGSGTAAESIGGSFAIRGYSVPDDEVTLIPLIGLPKMSVATTLVSVAVCPKLAEAFPAKLGSKPSYPVLAVTKLVICMRNGTPKVNANPAGILFAV